MAIIQKNLIVRIFKSLRFNELEYGCHLTFPFELELS